MNDIYVGRGWGGGSLDVTHAPKLHIAMKDEDPAYQ